MFICLLRVLSVGEVIDSRAVITRPAVEAKSRDRSLSHKPQVTALIDILVPLWRRKFIGPSRNSTIASVKQASDTRVNRDEVANAARIVALHMWLG